MSTRKKITLRFEETTPNQECASQAWEKPREAHKPWIWMQSSFEREVSLSPLPFPFSALPPPHAHSCMRSQGHGCPEVKGKALGYSCLLKLWTLASFLRRIPWVKYNLFHKVEAVWGRGIKLKMRQFERTLWAFGFLSIWHKLEFSEKIEPRFRKCAR